MKPLPPELDHPAWLHGLTAFTTVRTRQGQPLLWPAHLERLCQTCAFLGLPAPDAALPTLEPLPWGLLRVTVGGEGTFWTHRPLTPGPRPSVGVRVRLTDIQIHPQLAAHKTGNYLPYRLAMQRARDAFEVWLVGPNGTLADGSRTAPLLEIGGQLTVPAGGLPSVTRAAFLEGREWSEHKVHCAELPSITRAWLCGSGVGIVPVREIVGEDWSVTLPAEWPESDDWALIWPEG
ncbi:aminotransferase class IV [Deinococcus arenicola]|uniref:Aminotransferase class IV n=1 Tax=Deinococcus arenicola TaxID=2994950 RepID=A0ABU4DSK4_9DEIO|nr:aminotransferase class IV [Deinococcus sp. ZS9-10]MDV6375413.1 aminotransferase class IV [Deinococcus sp. ZS9-10]